MSPGERAKVEVEAIANGFLVREVKDADHCGIYGDWLFYPTLEAVERELVIRFRAAMALTTETGKADF